MRCEDFFNLRANGYCDDWTNNKACNYDGGDCCGLCVNTEYCIECECLEDVFDNSSTFSIFIGDGYCHDGTNKVQPVKKDLNKKFPKQKTFKTFIVNAKGPRYAIS